MYVCDGFCDVLVPASPKFQFQFVMVPVRIVELSVNAKGWLIHAVALFENAAVGGCVRKIVTVLLTAQEAVTVLVSTRTAFPAVISAADGV